MYMQQSSIEFLAQHKHIYDFYKLTGEIRHAGHAVYERMLGIAREYAPGYMCCLTCSGDVSKLVDYVYARYNELPKEDEFIKRETFTK